MTFSWSPAIKEAIESDIFAQKFSDFMRNWVVTGLTPSNGGSGILNIASGTCWIDGWRVETTGEAYDISSPDGAPRYVYIELSKDGSGKITSVDMTDYASSQTEDVRILIATPTVSGGLITAVGDIRQYDPIEPTLVRLKDDVSLSDWQHTSDLGKIDGAEIYAGTVDTTQIAGGAITNNEVDGSAAIAWSKIAVDSNIVYKNATETISGIWQHSNTIRLLTGNNVAFQWDGTSYGHIFATNGNLDIEGLNSGIIRIGANATRVHIKNMMRMVGGNILQFENSSSTILGTINAQSTDSFRFRTYNSADVYFNSDNLTYQDIYVEAVNNDINGGISPTIHEAGAIGLPGQNWFHVRGQQLFDTDGVLGSYSEREDLKDLRNIKEYCDSKGKPLKRGHHGDPVWNCKTIPHYLKCKEDLVRHKGTKREGDGYISSSAFKGWVISLFKQLDVIDTTQDEKLSMLLDEITALKARLEILE